MAFGCIPQINFVTFWQFEHSHSFAYLLPKHIDIGFSRVF